MTSGPAIDAGWHRDVGWHGPEAAPDEVGQSSQVDMESVVAQEIRPRCRHCGRDCAGPYGLGWSRARSAAGEWWLCATCTRATVGAIETGLDDQFG